MHSFVLSMFKIVGALMVSLLLFGIMFSSSGKTFIWGNLEPTFQNAWNAATMNDGDVMKAQLTKTFDNAKDLSS